jgi:hypothetical protein
VLFGDWGGEGGEPGAGGDEGDAEPVGGSGAVAEDEGGEEDGEGPVGQRFGCGLEMGFRGIGGNLVRVIGG